MNRKMLGVAAVAGLLILAVRLGFSDGREHRAANSAEGAAGSEG